MNRQGGITQPAAMLAAGVVVLMGIAAARGEGLRSFVELDAGWRIQSSADVHDGGAALSAVGYDAATWRPATMPSTVMGALVRNGEHKDLYVGKNLDAVATQPFHRSWWYRDEFEVTDEQASINAGLIFEGINYRANIWLNGEQIADAQKTFGAFRVFTLNVSKKIKPGKNAVAVEVFPPQPGDFTLGFVDWNPKPPDRNMGLFRPVRLHFHGSASIEHPFVESKIDHVSWSTAELTVRADLTNHAGAAQDVIFSCDVGQGVMSETFWLKPGETKSVKLSADTHPKLKITGARLWWPWEMGEPHLYTLRVGAAAGGVVTDAQNISFGIREVKDYMTPKGARGYIINGRKILIRGGGWVDDLLLIEDPAKLDAQVQYARALNLNTIRLEGVWGSSQRLYDLADKYGMLVMVGWSCQWEWKEYLGKETDENFGGIQSEADMTLAVDYLRDQVHWLRRHPSIFVWVLGSDMLPKRELEDRYDTLLAQIDPTRPTLKSCAKKKSAISGETGVKMEGPYDYVTPNYWYVDTKHGGAYGFNTETGPGPQPPPLESLRRMMPEEDLWPINDSWNFHCGRNEFNTLDRYMKAYNARYGEAKSVEEFAFRSQAANYEAIRAMYEAFGAGLPETTGIVQWMLNGAWPKLYWQLYDYYLMPGGAFYGAKDGARPINAVYHYGDQGVYLVNQSDQALKEYQTVVSVYDLNSKRIEQKSATASCDAYAAAKVVDLSGLKPATPVYFVSVALIDNNGKMVAEKFYWLSTKPDVLDEAKTEWFVTPNASYADFTALAKLPETEVQAQVAFAAPQAATGAAGAKGGAEATVTLTNTSERVAFFLELRAVDKSGQTLLPVFWDDNYISLPPGAKRTLHVRVPNVPDGDRPRMLMQGWNVKPRELK